MNCNCNLEDMIHAGKLHKKTYEYLQSNIKPNINLLDLANTIENQHPHNIAFPTGLSINDCVAHWTPTNTCNRKLLYDDVIKIDYGVHINGSIIDSAFTFTFNNKYDSLLESSKTSTELAIKLCRPDMLLSEIGKEIEENILSYELILNNKIYPIKPVKSLCGHKINKYEIHADKVIPNIYLKDYKKRISSDEYFAVETFTSSGSGETYTDDINCSHFMINYNKKILKSDIPNTASLFYKHIYKYFNTLAFCDRWIIGNILKKNKTNITIDYNYLQKNLNVLEKNQIINTYPPIYDINKNSYTAQFEETIYINEKKTIILSK